MTSVTFCKGFLPTSTPIQRRNESDIFRRHIIPELTKHALSPIKELLPIKKVFTECLYQLSDSGKKDYYKQAEKAAKKLFADDSSNSFKNNLNNSSNNNFNVSKLNESVSSFDKDSGIQLETSNSLIDVQTKSFLHKSGSVILSNQSDDGVFSLRGITFKEHSVCDNKLKNTTLSNSDEVLNKVRCTPNISKKVVKFSKKVNLDILYELKQMNCYAILSQVLSYLTDEELCKTSSVSKVWKEIVNEDKLASKRKENYRKERKKLFSGPNKENRLATNVAHFRDHKRIFYSLTNIPAEIDKQPLNLNSKSKHQSFLEVGKVLELDEKLLKCPKCLYPSKCKDGKQYSCTRDLCQYSFCNVCQGPYLANHKCFIHTNCENIPKIIIGSKKSKKNLKRL